MAFFDKNSFDPDKIIPKTFRFYELNLANAYTYLTSFTYLNSGADKLTQQIAELGNKAGIFIDQISKQEILPNLWPLPLKERLKLTSSVVGNNGTDEFVDSPVNETTNIQSNTKVYPVSEVNHYMDYVPIPDVEIDPAVESVVNYTVWWIEDNEYTQEFPTMQLQNHYIEEIPFPNDYPDDKEAVVDYAVWWD